MLHACLVDRSTSWLLIRWCGTDSTAAAHDSGVTGVAFSPDGKRLAASSNDGTVRIYALPLEDILAMAKSRVTRTLTTDECRKYLHVEQCPSTP